LLGQWIAEGEEDKLTHLLVGGKVRAMFVKMHS
jgi:hypothetical protein